MQRAGVRRGVAVADPGVPAEDQQRPVRVRRQRDGAVQPRGERHGGRRVRRREVPYPALHIIGEEIPAAVYGERRRRVPPPRGDRPRPAVAVGVNGAGEPVVGGRAFALRPAVITARLQDVDLLPIGRPHVRHVELVRRRDGERERVPQAVAIDRPIFAVGGGEERVVVRDRAVRADADRLALEGRKALGGFAGGLLAEDGVEHAVRPEMDPPALVPGRDAAAERRLVVAFEQNLFGTLGDRIADEREAGDAVVRERLLRDVDAVDVAVLGEGGVGRDADQAALPERVEVRQPQRRLREQCPVLDDAEGAGLFADQDAAVRQHAHPGGGVEAVGDDLLGEPGRQIERPDRLRGREVAQLPRPGGGGRQGEGGGERQTVSGHSVLDHSELRRGACPHRIMPGRSVRLPPPGRPPPVPLAVLADTHGRARRPPPPCGC